MSFSIDDWRDYQGKDTFYNVELVNLVNSSLEDYRMKVNNVKEEISLRIASYITKIPYTTLKSNKVKLKHLKTQVVIESQFTAYNSIERWVYNGEVLAEVIPDIEEITYTIKPFVYWEKDK